MGVSTNLSSFDLFYKATRVDSTKNQDSTITKTARNSATQILFNTLIPFLLNISIFALWNLQTGILQEKHGFWPVRYLYLAQGFKHCCLAYRLLFAQQVDTLLATKVPKLFYLDIIIVMVACHFFPGNLVGIARAFVY